MGGGETNPLDSRDAGDKFEQRAEVGRVEPIGINGLAEQDDLFHAARRESRDLAQNRVGWHAALASADVGYDAESAEAIAPAHRGNVGADAGGVIGRYIRVGLAAIEA